MGGAQGADRGAPDATRHTRSIQIPSPFWLLCSYTEDRLAAFTALGLDRLVAFPSRWDTSEDGLARFAEDVRAAGLPLAAGDLSLAAS